MTRSWWQDAVVYQIYPRSFCDTTGDGVGDLGGVIRHLGHISWLGADTVWLSPIYRSPMADFGYDVADHCDIDPLFGDLDTFDRLLAEAHSEGLRVLLDWVPNHTSNEHPWFLESRASRSSAKRDWYVWRDPAPDGGPPNNWVAAFDEQRPAWTYDDATEQYYLHLFLPEQPDLNWANPEVEAAMHDVLRFWLDRGVDGFRADVVHLIGKDPALPDDPEDRAGTSRVGFHDHAATHGLLRGIRKVLEEYPGERMMVGEINLDDTAAIARYHGEGDQLHLAFDFGLLRVGWDAEAWRATIMEVERVYRSADAWPTWVLSNHDEMRHRSRYGSLARARAAAVALLTLRGTPFLYAGEELGLADADVPAESRLDPGGRDGCRAPIPWRDHAGYGWAGRPWLPPPPDPATHSVEAQRRRPDSILHLYRRLLEARRASEALRAGSMELFDLHPDVLAFQRRTGTDRRVTLVNFGDRELRAGPPGEWYIEVSSAEHGGGHRGTTSDEHGAKRVRYDGRLAPEHAIVLHPA